MFIKTTQLKKLESFLASHWLLLVLCVASTLVFSSGFWFQGTLYWDNGKNFAQFRDTFHSLNRFGVPAWWLPHYQTGYPGYFFSMLAVPSYTNPAAALIAIPIYLLGRMGIYISHFQPYFVFYFGVIVPWLFLMAFWLFIRRIFKDPYCIGYAMIIAAFSPGIAFNVSDIGYLETSIYGLFFFSAFIDWMKVPSRTTYLRVLLTVALLGVSTNVGFFYFSLFSIPIFLLFFRKKVFKIFCQLPGWKLATLAIVYLIAFSPNLIVGTQGGDLVRISLGETKQYPFERLLPGSSMEFLTASLPGFGFDWKELRMLLLEINPNQHVAYYYMGLICLPLTIVGFLYGQRKLRFTLFFALAFFSLMVCLSAYSPYFAALMVFPTPLKGCNHFADSAYKTYTYLVAIMAATLGLKAVLRKSQAKKLFFRLVITSAVFTISVYAIFFGKEMFWKLPFTTFLAILFFFLVSFQWRRFVPYLLLFTLIDVSTFSFFWVRTLWDAKNISYKFEKRNVHIDETLAPNGIGLASANHSYHLPNMVLMYTAYFRMRLQDFDTNVLPRFRIFSSISSPASMETELDQVKFRGFESRPLAVAPEDMATELQSLSASTTRPIPHQIQILEETYNRFRLRVQTSEKGLFFVRDAYSPFWKATINGAPAKIYKVFYNFKGLLLEPGTHELIFQFSPSFVGLSISLSYFMIVLLFFLAFGHSIKGIFQLPKFQKLMPVQLAD